MVSANVQGTVMGLIPQNDFILNSTNREQSVENLNIEKDLTIGNLQYYKIKTINGIKMDDFNRFFHDQHSKVSIEGKCYQ